MNYNLTEALERIDHLEQAIEMCRKKNTLLQIELEWNKRPTHWASIKGWLRETRDKISGKQSKPIS